MPGEIAHPTEGGLMRRAVAASVLALLCASAGRGADPAAQTFHDALLAGTRKLKAAGFRCAQPLSGLLAGNRDDLARFRAALAEAALIVRAVADETKALSVPPTASARDLHVAYLKYLDFQERLVSKDLTDLLAALEDDKVAPAERRDRVARALARLAREEKEEHALLLRAYERFVAEHEVKQP
jgi:hypothetical protein